MTYAWEQLAASTNLPAADGVACVRLSNGNIFWHGGIYTQTMSTLYKAHDSNPTSVSLHATLPHAGRHTHFMFEGPWDGRAYIIGGDALGTVYQDNISSVDEDGNNFRVDLTGVPGLDCALFLAFVKGNYVYWGSGQKFTSIGGQSVPMMNLYRWGGPGYSPELVIEGVPYGRRGIYSNLLPEINGKHLIIGGGTYEDAGWPRFHQDDVVSIDASLNIKTLCPRLPAVLANRIWANQVAFDGKPWVMLGHNGAAGSNGDLTDTWYSNDEGATWVAGPTFTGTKRHAAAAVVIPSGPYAGVIVATGSHAFWSSGTATQMHRLWKDIYTYNAQQNGTTGFWGTTYTIIDRQMALPNNAVISTLGIKLSGARSINLKIAKENAANNFDIVYSCSLSHPGGGYADLTLPSPFTVPSSGLYRVGVSAALPSTPEAFANGSYNRAHVAGDATGTGVTMSPQTDGTLCFRWS